jgi:hypothetical protein
MSNVNLTDVRQCKTFFANGTKCKNHWCNQYVHAIKLLYIYIKTRYFIIQFFSDAHLPLVVPLPLLKTIGILFARFQATLGSGYPLASHLRWTDAPSATMVSLDVSLYKMSGASTTLSIPI